MSALDAVRRRAERATAALEGAERAHAAELAAAKERNRARRAEHWHKVNAEVLPVKAQEYQAARAAFAEAVRTSGDVGSAYSAYLAAHATWLATHNAVASGLAVYVNDLTGQPHADPDERWGIATYPDGVQSKTTDTPESFVRMLEAATKLAHEAHTRETNDALHGPLQSELEPEGD